MSKLKVTFEFTIETNAPMENLSLRLDNRREDGLMKYYRGLADPILLYDRKVARPDKEWKYEVKLGNYKYRTEPIRD